MRHLPLILIGSLALAGGCQTNPQTGDQELTQGGKAALREVASIAVRRYIGEATGAGNLERIRAILLELQQLPDITTIDGLRSLVQARINDRIQDPRDRQDLTSLLNIVAALLSDYVGAGQMGSSDIVRVREFLSYLSGAIPPAAV